MDPVIQMSVAFAFAALWLTAAAGKLWRFREFATTVADFRLLPRRLSPVFAALILTVEGGLGLALLSRDLRPDALAASAGLLVLYAAAIGVNLLRGRRHIDCGCGGPQMHQSLSGWLVWRNLLLAIGALVGSLPAVSRPLNWVDVTSVVGTVAAVSAFYAAINLLAANSRQVQGFGG